MYGLEAINEYNGWAVATVGISIVFTGLVLLSLIISQLHKVLNFKPGSKKKGRTAAASPAAVPAIEDIPEFSSAQKQAARQFMHLAAMLGSGFPMSELLNKAVASGLDQPHSLLSLLVKSRILTPDGQGYFNWNQDRFEQIVSHST